jgi:hypothetical protein
MLEIPGAVYAILPLLDQVLINHTLFLAIQPATLGCSTLIFEIHNNSSIFAV